LYLDRFLQAQENLFSQALNEACAGKKQTHWRWFIFPQYKGLGYSFKAKQFAFQSISEAIAYLQHPVLGDRLRTITNELLELNETNAYAVFGTPDDFKLKSCMTLFAQIDQAENNIFMQVINQYFNGEQDELTLQLLKQ
jgi:uncharacterized protein (DUF1810 family)